MSMHTDPASPSSPAAVAEPASFTDIAWPRIAAIAEDDGLARDALAELDRKTKPPGSLGQLEALAAQLARVQGRLRPRIEHAQVCVFAADHGVVAEGVSAFPQAVTAQMVANFLAGGAAVCVLARQFGAALTVVDAGVAAPLPAQSPQLLHRKIADGTANFARQPAMTAAQCAQALSRGIALGAALPAHGAFVPGEMGIGNTTSAAALMAALTGLDADACVGRGTGVDDAGLRRKAEAVARGVARLRAQASAAHASAAHVSDTLASDMPESDTHAHAEAARDAALRALCEVGGFEIAMMTGAMLGAAAARQVVVVDGFIATAAAAVALQLMPALRGYCVFAHVSAEAPHRRWLAQLGARPLLALDMRLGEASGALLALPLLHAAAAILCEMATFDSAGVSSGAASSDEATPG